MSPFRAPWLAIVALLQVSACYGGDEGTSPSVASGGTSSSGGAIATGGATSTGGSDGSGGGAVVELILPIERDGKYVLEFGSTLFEVDPEQGGRVTRFELEGRDVLADAGVTGDDINFGSTFWPSPQAGWYTGSDDTWPPIGTIDSEPYGAALEGQTIVLTSPPPDDPGLAQLSVVKRFRADLVGQAIVCEFELVNEDDEAGNWAAWQLTRVPPGGLSFFVTGTSVVYDQLTTSEAGGVTWFEHPSGVPSPLPEFPDAPKLSADAGEPWLAHVADGLLFVKTFPAVSPESFAPGHGEVELFAVGEYVELEAQGPATSLAPGASLSWTVRWSVRELPAGVAATAGNAALVELVRDVVGP